MTFHFLYFSVNVFEIMKESLSPECCLQSLLLREPVIGSEASQTGLESVFKVEDLLE